jgi:hypothetical protein
VNLVVVVTRYHCAAIWRPRHKRLFLEGSHTSKLDGVLVKSVLESEQESRR